MFPLKPSKPAETLPLFDEGPSSSIPSTQQETEPAVTRYKGVVLQQNGHWGAQIYVPHGRIWLGTFKSEVEAARAYDSAAVKLHHGDSDRNFPFSDVTIYEPAFQDHFSTEAILDMIRDGTYEPKLLEFVCTIHSPNSGGNGAAALPVAPVAVDGVLFKEMFQKELTPSDVGKLNRLVIPKKHAMRFFPPVSPDAVDGISLEFRDRLNRSWFFRYCYWKSSQSYVFTKGWNRFVKELGLRAKDTVIFYRCLQTEGLVRRSFCLIDIVRGVGSTGGAEAGSPVEDAEGNEKPTGSDLEEDKVEGLADLDESGEMKEMKLFGVWIR